MNPKDVPQEKGKKKDQNLKSHQCLIQSMLPIFTAFNCSGRQNTRVTVELLKINTCS